MIAAGGPGDREVRYVIKIAADPGNAAVVARETATLRAFEQRVAQAGASAGRTFANRFGGGGGGGGGVSTGGGAAMAAAAGWRFALLNQLRGMSDSPVAQEWAAAESARIRDRAASIIERARRAGPAGAAGFGLGRVMTGFAAPGVGTALGGIAAMGALSLGATKALVDPAGTSEAVGGWGVWGADKYASLMNWFGRFSPEGRAAEERGEYIADYFGNRKTAFLAQKNRPQERFRAARGLWDMENSSIAGARASARFDAALARARATGDFSGVQALSRSDLSAARRQLDGASGDAIGPAATEYISALERESQLIRENASARETLSQKMGNEIARMQQLQANRGTLAERYLRADPAERSLLNRAAAGDLATLSDRELLQAGNLGYNSPAYLAEAERRAKAQGLSTPQLDARIDAARSAAETFKQQLETGLGRNLGPLDEAFGKAGEAIGEIVAKKLVENAEKMAEAVQKALDASTAQNVNKGHAMLRRTQQVGLS